MPDICCINGEVIYVRSYHFITNSASYLNTAGFSEIFSVTVISGIESIGGGWGWVGSRRRTKATIWTQTTVLCPSVFDMNCCNPQGEPRLSLGVVWYSIHIY